MNIRHHSAHDAEFIRTIDSLVSCYTEQDDSGKEWIQKKLSYLVSIMIQEVKQRKPEALRKQASQNNIIIFPGCGAEAQTPIKE